MHLWFLVGFFGFSEVCESFVVAFDHVGVFGEEFFFGAVGDEVAVFGWELGPLGAVFAELGAGGGGLGDTVAAELAFLGGLGAGLLGLLLLLGLLALVAFFGWRLGLRFGGVLLFFEDFDHGVEVDDDSGLDFLGGEAGVFFFGESGFALVHAFGDLVHFGGGAVASGVFGLAGEFVEEVLVVELFCGVGVDDVGEVGAGGFWGVVVEDIVEEVFGV